jgi:hypothetical protein
MADDKRMERLMKRAKPFLDDKLKVNKRFLALKSVLEVATTDSDMSKFFEQHDYSIYVVCIDYFGYRTMKIKQKHIATSIFSDKDSLHIKDITDVIEIIEMVHKLVKFCKVKVKQGWQRHGSLTHYTRIFQIN